MKKYTAILILCIILLLPISYHVLHNTDILAKSLENSNKRFEQIAFVTSDIDGNIYIIDQYRTRLVKLNPHGEMVYEIKERNILQGTNSFFNELTVDNQGNVYAVCDVLDKDGYYITNSEIRKYSSDGRFTEVLHKLPLTQSGTRSIRGNYLDLKIIQDNLCYYITNGNVTTLYQLSLEDGQRCYQTAFHTVDADNLFHVTGSQTDVIYYETKDRKIYRTDISGKTQEVFRENTKDLEKEIIPRRVVSTPEGTLYFLDVVRSRLYRIDPGKAFNDNEYISLGNLSKGEEFNGTKRYTALMPIDHGNKILVADENTYVVFDQDGTLLKASNIAHMTWQEQEKTLLLWVEAAASVMLLIAIILLLYFKILNRRLILFLKYTLVLIPSFLIMMAFIGYYMYSVISESSVNDRLGKLEVAAKSSSLMLAGELDRINNPQQCLESGFKAALTRSNKILQDGSDVRKKAGMYATIYKRIGDRIYVVYDFDWNTMPFTLYADNYKTSDLAEVFTSGKDIAGRNDADVNGQYMDYVTPVYNDRNEIIGAFEAGVYKYGIDNMMKSLQKWFLLIILGSTVILAFLIMATNGVVLQSLSTLRKGVNEIARGNLEVAVEVNTQDEVGDLCEGFNTMADYIRDSVKKSRQTSEAYFRFVPERMLQMLGKRSIADIKTGDTVKRDMSVMSLNIGSFYLISQSMTAEQNYAYINSLLERFGPVIRENGGIVEKYLGAAISSIFPDRAEDAVQSAVRIISIMEDLNAEATVISKEQRLDINIGLYKGNIMLGIIGEEKRMECSMILDDGNIPQQMTRLARKLGVSMLASESIMQSLENSSAYLHRYMGNIKFEGTTQPIKVYDIFQGNSQRIRIARADTKEIFEEGISLYEQGQFLEARTCFIEVLKRDRGDTAAKTYFYLSDESYQNGDMHPGEGFLDSNFII